MGEKTIKEKTKYTQEDRKYFPMLARGSKFDDGDEIQKWESLRQVDEVTREYLLSGSIVDKIKKFSLAHNLVDAEIALMVIAIRDILLERHPIGHFVNLAQKDVGIRNEKKEQLLSAIKRIISHKKNTKDTKERMTLREALDRFAEIKDQVITEGRLTVAGAQRQQAGTIENWLTDYHLAIGQGRHSAIERGNYLFHNRNTKPLSAADRQRVAMVLKSFDEDMKMAVDVARKQIVFPLAQKIPHRSGVQKSPTPVRRQPPVAQRAPQRHAAQKGAIMKKQPVAPQRKRAAQPLGYVNFSSGQRLSREKDRTE